MRHIQALLLLILLITSKRYREKWRQTTDRLSDANDGAEASFRRLNAMHNGGKPKMRLLQCSQPGPDGEHHWRYYYSGKKNQDAVEAESQ